MTSIFPSLTAQSRVQGCKLAAITCLLIAPLYFACARIYNGGFTNQNLDGYYDLLGRALLRGHVYLPVNPAPELSRLADPYDPDKNAPYRLHDAVLFGGRYYLYHGVVPAVVLFAPWRFLTGCDLPESFAAVLFCLAGYLFSAKLLIDLLGYTGIALSPTLFMVLLSGMGLAQSVPYLLERVLIYEIAIASGYCFLTAGFFFFFKLMTSPIKQSTFAVASGACFALAVGCRPQLVLVGLTAVSFLVLIALREGGRSALICRHLIQFTIPYATIGIVLAFYNYARFGNFLEFGVRYQLGGISHPSEALHFANVLPGLSHLFFNTAQLEFIFPFIRLRMPAAFLSPDFVLRAGNMYEPIIGCVILCPLTLLGLSTPYFVRRLGSPEPAKTVLWLIFLSAGICALFVAGTGWTTQRYEVDFMPELLLLGCYFAASMAEKSKGWRSGLIVSATAVTLALSISSNLALAAQGPDDTFVQRRPSLYVALARKLSISENLRPLLNPEFEAEAQVEVPHSRMKEAEPLIVVGEFGSRYILEAQILNDKLLKLTSATVDDKSKGAASTLVKLKPGRNAVRLAFNRLNRCMSIYWNGDEVLKQQLPFLVAAPAQIHFGSDSLFGRTRHFRGTIIPLSWAIEPAPSSYSR